MSHCHIVHQQMCLMVCVTPSPHSNNVTLSHRASADVSYGRCHTFTSLKQCHTVTYVHQQMCLMVGVTPSPHSNHVTLSHRASADVSYGRCHTVISLKQCHIVHQQMCLMVGVTPSPHSNNVTLSHTCIQIVEYQRKLIHFIVKHQLEVCRLNLMPTNR